MSTRRLPPVQGVWLVARREIGTRVRSKAFVIGTVVMLAVIGGWVGFAVFLGQSDARSTVGVTERTAPLAEPISAAAQDFGRSVEPVDVSDVDAGERQVREGDLDVLLTGSPTEPRALVEDDLGEELRAAINTAARQQALDLQLQQVGADPVQVRSAMAAAQVEVESLQAEDPYQGQRLAVALVAAGLLYFSLVLFGMTVAQGVVEEKSSRVIELLLAAVRPWQLLGGKILGIGLTGLLQLAVIAGVGAAAAIGTGVLDAPALRGAVVGTVGWALLWYLLGYFLFAAMYAAAGALVSRQEDINPVVQPLVFLVLVPFLVAVSLLPRNPDSAVAEVLSMIPLFSPILMPARIAIGVAPVWQIAASVLLTVALTAAVVRLGGRIYARGVLHTGGRLSLGRALRS